MLEILAFHHLSLSVTDLTRSTEWYQQVLGFDIADQIERDGFRRTRLRAPNSGLTLSLTAHADQLGERFDEHRPGMDHVAFQVAAADVDALQLRLETQGVVHSQAKASAGGAVMITLRDPDNIQIEIFTGPLPT